MADIDSVGGPSAEEQDKEKNNKKLVAKILEIDFTSGIDVYENKKEIKPPHWKYIGL